MAKADKKDVKASMYDVIVSPVVTEKSQMGVEQNKFTFTVAIWATKTQVKQAVKGVFDVEADKVNIIVNKGKVKRFRGIIGKRKDTKKAIITLKEGQTIDAVSAA